MPDDHSTKPQLSAFRRTKPIPDFTPERLQRFFWPRVLLTPGPCWTWTGTIRPDGYGVWENCFVHRIAYTLKYGPIPDSLTIDHVCRNRVCVNPEHLEAVSISENVHRRERGVSTGPQPAPRKRTAERFHRRRERGVCVQCNTPAAKYRCDRCRAIHNARGKGRKR